jgi:predicted nucleic acid-binding protein
MKEVLFIDTWGWVVIHNKREPRHYEVDALYREFRLNGGSIYTTDYVLDETFTLLFRRLPLPIAEESVGLLDEAIKEGYLNLEWVSPERFEEAKELRLRFRDKPKISFTDLTSMVVMKELGVSSILTDDDHFTHVGMGFEKMP